MCDISSVDCHAKLQVYFAAYCLSLIRATNFLNLLMHVFLFSASVLSYHLFTTELCYFHNPVSGALVMAVCACVHFERALVLAFNNNPVPKRQTLRDCHSYTRSVAAEFGFGTSSTAVTRLEVYLWRAKAWILACVAILLPVVSVASPLSESKPNVTVCNVYLTV